MAAGFNNTGIQWATVAYKDLTTSARADSDAFSTNLNAISQSLTVRADNQGTPASGDVVNVYIKWSDGTNYDTDEHAQFLYQLDTYSTNTPGEDPAQKTIELPLTPQNFKLSVEAPQGASRTIRVSASVADLRTA